MRANIIIWWIFFAFTGLGQAVFAQKPWILNDHTLSYSVGLHVDYIEDKTHRLNFADVTRSDAPYTPSRKSSLNFGYSKSAFWFRLRVSKALQSKHTWIFETTHTLMDSLDVYFVNSRGSLLQHYTTGGLLPFRTRAIPSRTFAFPLPLTGTDTLTVYVHARGNSAKQFPIYLLPESSFYQKLAYETGKIALYTGFFVCLILYNLFLYLSLRNSSYIFYIGHISGFLLFQLAIRGELHAYFPDQLVFVANLSNLFFVGMTVFFGSAFAHSFLQIHLQAPRSQPLFWFLEGGGLSLMLLTMLSVWLPSLLGFLPMMASVMGLLTVVIVAPSSLYVWWQGYQPARFYVLAWAAVFCSILLYVGWITGILNYAYPVQTFQIASVMEALLFSLALADRIKLTEREKREAQQKVIEGLREKEEMVSAQNRILEERVQERTQALHQKTLALEQANQELKDKNSAIISSITYAQRIQQSMLPATEEINNTLASIGAEAFVLFKPRDLVSGDFYWLFDTGEVIVLAAVDCTGHGVPGAFMSMVGNDLLNEIVGLRGITAPDEILQQLHLGVRNALRQRETGNQDGMDIALVSINRNTRTLSYAGAKNPLILIQNDETTQINADRLTIGGAQRDVNRQFTSRSIALVPPVSFYLFTDGYQDQFGGENGKKFMLKQLRDLLGQIHTLPALRQREALLQHLEDWMTHQAHPSNQIDDVLVIGVKIDA